MGNWKKVNMSTIDEVMKEDVAKRMKDFERKKYKSIDFT